MRSGNTRRPDPLRLEHRTDCIEIDHVARRQPFKLSTSSLSPRKHARSGGGVLGMPIPYLRWPVAMLLLGLAFSLLAAQQIGRLSHRVDSERFEHEVTQTHVALRERLEIYIALLEAGAGLFDAQEVNAAAFHRFATRLDLRTRYPGIQGIGWTARAPEGGDEQLLAVGRREHGVGFHLWPSAHQERHAILYLEPLDRRNRAALGFDMHSEPVRRAAMDQSRDTGRTVASGRVQLVQEIDQNKQAGFLIYVPVYRGGATPDSLDKRRRELKGFVYSAFRADDLLRRVFTDQGPNSRIRFAVYDGAPQPVNLLHRSEAAWDTRTRFERTTSLAVAGRTWTVIHQARPPFFAASRQRVAPMFLAGGLLATLALFVASLAQARHRFAADSAVEAAAREISARIEVEGRQKLLIDELNHRVKNTLASVQSVAAQTLRHTTSPAEFKDAFTSRLVALSEAHNLLAREHWRGAALADLVDVQLRPFGPERYSSLGPAVTLNPAQAVALGMLLHELAANASKYGALSRPGGKVAVAWRLESAGRLTLDWREAGGPRVTAPTRRGFGTRLIERGLAQELRGEAQLRFDPQGLTCHLAINLAEATPPPAFAAL